MWPGKKTYVLAALICCTVLAHGAGVLTQDQYETLVGMLLAGAIATLRAAIGNWL